MTEQSKIEVAEANIELKSSNKYQKTILKIKFFLDLQTCFCTTFTQIDAAPKRIKLQRSAWWQIEAFLKCYPIATKEFICLKKIMS